MNYLDLFSGIGGFHEGLKDAGFKFDWVGFSEIDKHAKQIYQRHFLEAEDLGNVRTIDTSRLPRIHLITFGFPCQDISIAGKRAGLQGERSGLFSEAIRIIRDTQPDYFIFENVKGLFSSNQGRDFEHILRTIADIGYDGQWQLLNTRWVLPQNRERIYFVGYPRNKRGQKIFPIGEGNGIFEEKDRGQQSEGERISSTIDSRYGSLRNAGETYLIQIGVINKDAQGQRVYDPDGIACSLTGCSGGHGGKTGLYCVAMRGRNPQNPSDKTTGIHTEQRLEINSEGITNSLTSVQKDNLIVEKKSNIRRLTPREAERLQGFRDGWTEGISDSQRYKCLGNAVTVPIVKMVGEKLLEVIQNARS